MAELSSRGGGTHVTARRVVVDVAIGERHDGDADVDPSSLATSGRSLSTEQANSAAVSCRWEELKSPDHSMPVSGMHICMCT